MEKTEKEYVEHEVAISELITARIKIAKVLTAFELKALMVKASKLLNLSDVPLEDGKPAQASHSSTMGPRTSWNDESDKLMMSMWQKGSSINEIQAALEDSGLDSLNKGKIWARKDYLLRTGRWANTNGQLVKCGDRSQMVKCGDIERVRSSTTDYENKLQAAALLVLDENLSLNAALAKTLGRQAAFKDNTRLRKAVEELEQTRKGDSKHEN